MANIFEKFPSEARPILFDYSTQLTGGEVLNTGTPASTVVTVPAGLTAGAMTVMSTSVLQVISGGTAGQSYIVNCDAATASGYTIRMNAQITMRAPDALE